MFRVLLLLSLVTAMQMYSLNRPLMRVLSSTMKQSRLVRSMTSNTKETGHIYNGSAKAPEISASDQLVINKFVENQRNVPRISMAEEVRTLINQSIGYGILSTNSLDIPGYPTGSVVGFELDDEGYPFFVFSTMSAHAKDVLKDSKVSLTVLANDFKGAAEGRVVIVGNVKKLFDKEKEKALRDKYLLKHKDAYWIDFGDFAFFKMTSIEAVRFIGGFAMAGTVTSQDYLSAKPDPVAPFSMPVAKHMNEDHLDSIEAMVSHYAGIPCTDPKIIKIDRLGMVVTANITVANLGYNKIRLPFPSPVTERKQLKEMIVEMTKASAK